MKVVRFFASNGDVLEVLREIEKSADLQYVRAGILPASFIDRFERAQDIPNLGRATHESAISSESFLVADKTLTLLPRNVSHNDGTTSFCLDQLNNPDAAVFTPAGNWGTDTVLYGTMGTASDSPASIKVVKLFERAIKKKFTKIKAYWVGPTAFTLLTQGRRLTIAVQSPRELDLSMD
ncbi:MAG TPA: hypothetical protein VFS47_03640 [Steroidobacteraceae bacterium]|nr:hypothetical protein [Steroidobacteraceae bacterium]